MNVRVGSVQKQLAPDHPVLCMVAHVYEHRDEAARVVKMDGPEVPDAALMYVHTNPQLVRVVFDFAQRRPLLINAVFAIGDVTRLGQIELTARALPDLRELLLTPFDERLTVKGVEQGLPRGLFVEQALVALVAPVE